MGGDQAAAREGEAGAEPAAGARAVDPAVRAAIVSDAGAILEDREAMRALAQASSRAMGPNVIDLRALAMERLEARLSRLEDAHRSVIAAAYDAVAGTAQVHRAALRMLEARSLAEFVQDLEGDVAAILRVDAVLLVLEADGEQAARGALRLAAPGEADRYLGRSRPVALRAVTGGEGRLHGAEVRSEACLRLDLGGGRTGLLLLGSHDGRQFAASQGTDLLAFLGGVAERALRALLP